MSSRNALAMLAALTLLATGAAGCTTTEKRVVGQRLMSEDAGVATSIVDTKIAEYEQLASQFPKEPKYQERLASLHWIREDHTRALEHLAEARALDPDDAKYELMEARIHYAIKNYQGAEERYKKLIERFGDEFDGPIYELAWLYMIDARYDLAEEHFQRCLNMNPRLAGAHYGLGRIMLDRKETTKAIAHYEEYLKLGGGVHHEEVLRSLRRMQPGLYNYKP